MRYAIVSDVHANRQAFNAVMTDIRAMGCSQIICLGDVIGYGPSPAAVLEKAYSRVDHFVLGNHDAVLCGSADPSAFNDDARHIIEWTQRQLDAKAGSFFEGLPLIIKGEGFRCAHAEFAVPLQFRYLVEPDDAQAAWGCSTEPLLFVGHTHRPALFVVGASGTPHVLTAQDFALEDGKRYIVNVGAVGQPRDGDVRASYCVYDTDKRSVYYRRVAFDVESYRDEVRKAQLPEKPQYFLSVAARQEAPPLRELLDFRPPAVPAKTDYRVADLEQMRRSMRRWRLAGLLLAVLCVAALGVAGAVYRAAPRPVVYPALRQELPAELAKADGAELVLMPTADGEITAARRLDTWNVTLQIPASQGVRVARDTAEDGPTASTLFRLHSDLPQPLKLTSWRIPAAKGDRFQARAQFNGAALKSGHAALQLVLDNADGTQTVLDQKEAAGLTPGKDEWGRQVQFTLEKKTGALPRAGMVHLVVAAEFSGELQVRKCSLLRKD